MMFSIIKENAFFEIACQDRTFHRRLKVLLNEGDNTLLYEYVLKQGEKAGVSPFKVNPYENSLEDFRAEVEGYLDKRNSLGYRAV